MENLHFVRPMMFFGFIPLALILIALYRHNGTNINWKLVCDTKLLPYILSQNANKSSRFPLLLVFISASLCIISAAGPAFEKLAKPVYREQSTLVILMDLSQSMDAGDIKPTRMQRAKLKLLDILKSRKAGQTAVIVYAADAFTVTPLTDDSNTIANLVPTFETSLMPSQGSHAYTAIDKSIELLQQAGASNGDVLLMTDDITDRDLRSINDLVEKGHRLSILGVGTEDGGPISINGGFLQDSSGAIVIAKLDENKLQSAALAGSGLYARIQADDTDIDRLNNLFSSKKVKQGDDNSDSMELTADSWQEEGPWLLLLVIPMVALWARKGWLLCFTILILPVPDQAYALDLDNLWRNPDQRAMSLFNAGDTKNAAEQFQQNNWKASAHYRSGNYEKALEALQNPISSDDYYNKGNALAKLGRFPEAVKAYDEALNLDANNEDANFNREQVKKQIKEQQQSEDGEGKKGDKSDDSQESEKDSKDQTGEQDSKDEQSQSSDEKNAEDQKDQQNSDNDDSPESQQQKNSEQGNSEKENQSAEQQEQDKDKVEQAMKDAQEKPEDAENNQDQEAQQVAQPEETELSEEDQAVEQWLKRVPDNPEQLLKRKFLYQYKHMERKTPSEQSW